MVAPNSVQAAIDELTDRLSVAQTRQSVTDALGKFANALDFEWFTYLSIQGPTVYGLSNYPNAWQRAYLDGGFSRVDPIVQGAADRQEAFAWSQWSPPIEMDRDHQRFMADARKHGIRSGVSIPIREGFGRRALLTLSGSDPRPRQDLEFPPFTALALGAYLDGTLRSRFAQLLEASSCPLTPVQLQCLTWLLRGKSNEDIAELRGCSRRAVEAHLQNIRERLGVATTYQAIATAIERRWISL